MLWALSASLRSKRISGQQLAASRGFAVFRKLVFPGVSDGFPFSAGFF